MSYNRKNPLLNTTKEDEEFQHYDDNNTGNYSDSEAINRRKRDNKSNFNDLSWNKKLNSLRNNNTNTTSPQGYQRINDIDAENCTDDDDDDDFNNNNLNTTTSLNNIKSLESNKFVKTGRQRKKLAARSKGGEFATRRRKKRIYFCCLSSEINVSKLHEHLTHIHGLKGWTFKMYSDVLHIHKPGMIFVYNNYALL